MGGLVERLERLRALRAQDLSSVLAAPLSGDGQISEAGEARLSSVLAVPPPTCGQFLGGFSFRPRVDSLDPVPPPSIRPLPRVDGENPGIPGERHCQNRQKTSSPGSSPRAKKLPASTDWDCQNCQKPPAPVWHDLDGWRERWREAATVDLRREVVVAWAETAGGEVADGTLRLPTGLPRRLVQAEMVANAGYVGLAIAELPLLRCSWCPEPPLPGDRLCDHCRWLAGPSPAPALRAEPIPRTIPSASRRGFSQ